MEANSGIAHQIGARVVEAGAIVEEDGGPLSRRGDDIGDGEHYIRVKTRTGQPRVRGGRTWQPDKWARVKVDSATLAVLKADAALDVEALRVGSPVDVTEPTDADRVVILQTALAEALRHVDRVDRENADLRLAMAKAAKAR